ncbi:hypothetical protein DLAC_05636 [Tieghemostelium lacteum]|uniref:SKICH domain-containing protein n=1 Tax=Tieghemostelium lacteum TaxID=361077 RepID=A0A151ZGH7_TIELA|nr:hypothetical protein DLAC_05636 [Tieghemostelium lacteum]|eukprot:KYQ93027.1 hypothetical protein DLAC_05636 [Tieghemostelium lacteum]
MTDTESKVNSLAEAFKHDRVTIYNVLKKNNFSLDEAAFELSEMPVVVQPVQFPVQQPIPQYPNIPQPIPNRVQPNLFVPPPPIKQQPIVQKKPQQQEDDEDVVYTEITKQLGDTGLTESTIYDIHKQGGKNLGNTVRTIKTMTYNPTEEHKKMEEIQKKYEQEQKLKEMMELESKAIEQERMEMEHVMRQIEKERVERERLERMEREKFESLRKTQEANKKMIEERKKQEMMAQIEAQKNMEDKKRKEMMAQLEAQKKLEEKRRELEQKEKESLTKEQDLKRQIEAKAQEEMRRKEEETRLRLEQKRFEELRKVEESKRLELEKKRIEAEQKILATQKLLLEKEQSEAKAREQLEIKSRMAQDMLKQQEEFATLKEISHNKLIESQKKEILDFQMQIDILKQKEFQAQQENVNMSKKSQLEIENLRLRLAMEEELKTKENQLKRENEEILRQQIHDLESQKEMQRIQILELENIKKKQILELEHELQSKQNELNQTKKSNFITLTIELDSAQKDQINVDWALESKYEATANYWIGIYPTHQPKNERYLVFKVIKGAEGTVSFPSIIPGHYEARLFRDKYSLLQTSSSVQVGPTVNIGVHVIGDQINVTFDVPSQPDYNYSRDWVGIYTLTARNKKYSESLYANATKSVTFASPRVPGIYEVRYFVYPTKYNEQVKSTFELVDNDSVVISTPIASPEEEFKVEYTINTIQPSTSDWVGIFSVDEENNKNYISSKYTNGTGHGELNLNAPSKPGEYEVRFFSYTKGKYITHKISNRFLVTGISN